MSVASRKREKEYTVKFNKTVPDWVKDQVSRQYKEDGFLRMSEKPLKDPVARLLKVAGEE